MNAGWYNSSVAQTGESSSLDPSRRAEADVPSKGAPAWYERLGDLPGGRFRVRCLIGGDHPDGTVVANPRSTAGLFELWRADLDAEGRPTIWVNPMAVPGAPELWFVALREAGPPPAMSLVGFEVPAVPAGTVVSDAAFFSLPVRNVDQAAAIRWWPDEAVVDQVYVGDAYRRRHAATLMIYAASAFHQLHGWPNRLHSDGRRTAMGQQLVAGLRHPARIAPLEHLMAPMDDHREPRGSRRPSAD
jgi:hypothetical protein